MEPIISVRGLGKSYRIQTGERKPYRTLRDDIADFGKGLLKGQWGNSKTEEFWALKDIDFDIYPGEVVGIIGRNGAGKSTLLKVLSRVVQPTTGEAILKGRVASLLEVGTGFHPELTGRENIFMSGAVSGMKRTEIRQKFDEIVAFSEVEKFIDIPVKRFSSGMYVRLAFAVAAHLEPEILLIDEVLAVGDSQFQEKCLGKIGNIRKEGRTVFFVSHNLAAVLSLCDRALLIQKGICIGDDRPDIMIGKYLNSETMHGGELIDEGDIKIDKKVKIRRLKIANEFGDSSLEFNLKDNVFLEVYFDVVAPGKGYSIGFQLHSIKFGCIFTSNMFDKEPEITLGSLIGKGNYQVKVRLPTEIMRGGKYWVKVVCVIPNVEIIDVFNQELHFSFLDTDTPDAKIFEDRDGSILPILEWNII
jgi:lipopolysaccharide transport system ATP-binding protein